MNAVVETEDLEALFDQVAAASAAKRDAADSAGAPMYGRMNDAGSMPSAVVTSTLQERSSSVDGDLFHRVGHLTRTLHDALRELGYDRGIEEAVQTMPDARDRLSQIATLTGQAAERTLGAVERAQEVQQHLAEDSARLATQWDKLYAGSLSVDAFKALAGETRAYLSSSAQRAALTRTELHEIMMAQDFHDLTGQIINRVLTLAQQLEAQLVKLLVEASPAERPGRTPSGSEEWLSGPAINAEKRSDVVANQAQVDDLLESLGF